MTPRETWPDNTLFTQQWALFDGSMSNDIRAPWAWDYGVGRSSNSRDEAVVAVIDGGFDLDHVSLKDNNWTNYLEIPGNQ